MSDCKDEVMKAEGAKKTEEEGARALEGQDKPPEDGRVYFRDEESGLWWEDIGRDPTSATYRDAETDLLISARGNCALRYYNVSISKEDRSEEF